MFVVTKDIKMDLKNWCFDQIRLRKMTHINTFAYVAESDLEHQYHRVVSPSNGGTCPLSFATFGSGSQDYAFMRGVLVRIPQELVPCPERFNFTYRILDSNGHMTTGTIYYQTRQSPNFPEFTFVAHRGVYYTIVSTVSLPSGMEAHHSIMFVPIPEDVSADYLGDSLPKPFVTKEQLDEGLDEIVLNREMCRNVMGGVDCKCLQNPVTDDYIPLGTANDEQTIQDGGCRFDRLDQLLDEDYAAVQKYKEMHCDDAPTYDQEESSDGESSDDESPRKFDAARSNVGIDESMEKSEKTLPNTESVDMNVKVIASRRLNWKNPKDREKLKVLHPQFYQAVKEHEDTPPTAAARAACYQELAGQW